MTLSVGRQRVTDSYYNLFKITYKLSSIQRRSRPWYYRRVLFVWARYTRRASVLPLVRFSIVGEHLTSCTDVMIIRRGVGRSLIFTRRHNQICSAQYYLCLALCTRTGSRPSTCRVHVIHTYTELVKSPIDRYTVWSYIVKYLWHNYMAYPRGGG